MSVLAVQETFRGQTADSDNKGIRNYLRVFQVELSSRSISPAVALAASGIPTVNSAYPDDTLCTCRKLGASRMSDHPQWWEIKSEYSNQNDGQSKSPDQSGQQPTDRPVKVTCGSVGRRKVLDKDYTDPDRKPVVNSAKEKFDPPVEIDDSMLSITVVRNETSFDLGLPFAYQNRVNKDNWNGIEPGYVRCTKISATDKYEMGVRYWEVTYEFEINPTSWDLEVLDQGYTQVVGGKRILIRDEKDDTPLSKPALLDGAGAKLAIGGTPAFLTFKPYRQTNFSGLGLAGILA